MNRPRNTTRPFVLVAFPDGRREEVPTHALGKQLARIDEVFALIGSKLVLTIKAKKLPKSRTMRGGAAYSLAARTAPTPQQLRSMAIARAGLARKRAALKKAKSRPKRRPPTPASDGGVK